MKGRNLYLNGTWASSIRYHNGKFYVAFCTPYGWKTKTEHLSVCEADKPEGPWTRTILPEYLYNPCLLFDEQRKSICRTQSAHLVRHRVDHRCKVGKGNSRQNMGQRGRQRPAIREKHRNGGNSRLQNQRNVLYDLSGRRHGKLAGMPALHQYL